MAYRFDTFDDRALLWREEAIFNYQPVFFIGDFDGQGGDISPITFPSLDYSQNLDYSLSKPLYAPPVVNDDVITASTIASTFDVFVDNGNGADTDPEGDNFFITQINGTAVTAGNTIVLASGLELVFW